MTITEVRTRQVTVALHTPFVTALRRTTTMTTLVVMVSDDEGHTGYGEAPQVWQVTGASVAGSQACVDEVLGPLLRGRDPDDLTVLCGCVRRAVAGNEAAKAAVDVALHDLAAQRLGVPLVRLLGGTSHDSRLDRTGHDSGLDGTGHGPGRVDTSRPDGRRVATDVTLSAGTPTELAAAATARVADGFGVLKIKVGTDAAGDLDRVRAARDAAGPAARLRLDANQGWTPREAVTVIRAVEDAGLDVEFVEQPVARADLAGLAWVTDRVNTPIVADEAVFSPRDLVEVIHRRAADLVNVKLAKCGGLGPARTLLALAEEYGVGTMVGSMMEGPIGVGAAASLAAAAGTTVVSDLDAAWWLAEPLVKGGPSYAGPWVVLPDAPGLGVGGLMPCANESDVPTSWE